MDGHLGPGEVHVWLARLDEVPPFAWETVLSSDERHRAARLLFPRDRERFMIVRGLLRRLLACYVGTEPGAVRFSYQQYGKPSLAAHSGSPFFNVSHSHEAAAFAVTREGDVGVDIEALRPVRAAQRIADRYFPLEDAEALRSLPPPQRLRGFFTCWARREAFVKAVGRGLSLPVSSVPAAATGGELPRLAPEETAGWRRSPWTIAELPGIEGYVGAVAVCAEPRVIHYRAWNGSDCRSATPRCGDEEIGV